jgi:DNA invertase Pin-like site-specific DNA recombinase
MRSASHRNGDRRSVLRLYDIRAALNFAWFHVVLKECGHLDGFLNAFQAVGIRALESFKAQGIEFISFSEQLTSTPPGKLVFAVLGAVAELERSIFVERVRAGMRNAHAKRKQIGRPPLTHLSCDARRTIYESHKAGDASHRQLAAKFSTPIASVQRCMRASQSSTE